MLSARKQIAAPIICASFAVASSFAQANEFADQHALGASPDSVVAPIFFRDGQIHRHVLDNVEGMAMAEGDIIVGHADKFFSNSNRRATRGLSNTVYGSVWPNGLVPYNINDDLSDSVKAKVRGAIEKWNGTGAITLVERTASTAAAYPNYIDFVEAQQCASWVGFQNTGAQSIYTGDRCSEGSMIHEIGHALGLLHEHTRPDRDNFVSINWDNINPDKTHNFDILENAIPLGDYDYDSIMHYGTHFFSDQGGQTITPLQNVSGVVGQREYISPGDASAVRKLYESEFSLVASPASEIVLNNTQAILDLHVTNNTDMGANNMSLRTEVPAGVELISFSSSNWTCYQPSAGADVDCTSPVLAANANTQVSLNLSTPSSIGTIQFNSELASETIDTDLSNNQDKSSVQVTATEDDVPVQVVTPEPVIAAAKVSSGGSSGGGGAFGLFSLLVFCARRRQQ